MIRYNDYYDNNAIANGHLIQVFLIAIFCTHFRFTNCQLELDFDTMNPDVEKFVVNLKKKYKGRLVNREKQWPPRNSSKLVRLQLVNKRKEELSSTSTQEDRDEYVLSQLSLSDHYVYLCMFDDSYVVQRSKEEVHTPLAYCNLFEGENGKAEPVKKVLIEGGAGIGKTTLTISLSEDWACDKLFQTFDILLLLPLRHEKVASAGTLSELLNLLHSGPDTCQSVASYLEEEEGERVLIIADGWDELSESQRSEGSFLYKLLFVQFPLMSVVVTSRPSASAPLHNLACIDRFVEIKGFGEDDITEYIRSEFPSDQEKAQRLLEQLEYNPLIESVCSVPLNCAIVCHLWHTLNEALPSTMTKLYKSIIMHFVCRNLRKTAAYGATFSMEGFDDLPEALQKSWWLLCEFAFKALERDQIVFSKQKLLEFFPKGNEDLLLFGLLQPVEEVLDLTSVVSYNFLHLTFMEYLAALHLSKQSLDSSMLKLLKNNRFDMVLRFYFGIRFCDSKGEADIDVVQQAIQCIKNKSSRWHCVFEAQNAIVNSEVQFDRFLDWPRNPHDCAAVLYVIASMQECSDLKIGFGYTGVRENQISELTDVLASKHGKLQVKKLFLSGNKLTDKTVSNLFNRASAAFHSFTLLDLVHNRIGAETIKSITTALAKSSSSKCKHIYLSNNPLEVSGLQALENAVREGVLPKLEVLDLTASLTGDADANASWLATFGEALSAHCPYLRRLNLSQNNLGVSGATALARVVSRLRQPHSSNVGGLAFLSLDQTNIGDEGLCAFVDSIEGVCHFDILYLNHNDIRATGVSCLTDAVCSGKVVIKMFFSCLHLHGNPLGLEGALAVGRMISSNRCQLDKLNLSRCMLTTVESSLWNVVPLNLAIGNNLSSEAVLDVQQLCQMPQNHSITMLGLNGTSFTGNGIHVLAAFMYLCPSLEDLHTISCGITSDDITKLFLILKSSFPDMLFGKLQSWFLQSNEIDNDGISALIGHLPSLFPSLFNIKISNNRTVSREVKEELDKELRRRKEVRCCKAVLFDSSMLKLIHGTLIIHDDIVIVLIV